LLKNEISLTVSSPSADRPVGQAGDAGILEEEGLERRIRRLYVVWGDFPR
jgi:hypothetical protein